MIHGLVYQLYYSLKDFFKNLFKRSDDDILRITDTNYSEDIIYLENEIIQMYNKIDLNSLYSDLNILNNYFNKKTNITKIIEFLEYETQFIYNNKTSLNIHLNEIKHNMIVIRLLEKFKYLEEINKKELEVTVLKNHRL